MLLLRFKQITFGSMAERQLMTASWAQQNKLPTENANKYNPYYIIHMLNKRANAFVLVFEQP